MPKRYGLVMLLMAFGGLFAGCQPKTTSEKIQDKAEDATHEAGQGIERAGERVKDAAK